MRPDLSTRAVDARELMDAPDADERMLGRTYDRFRIVNALVSRPGGVYRRDVRPRARHGRVRILDVGAGGGDLCRDLARRLHRDGLSADITALDADERAIRWASDHDGGAGIRYRCAFSHELVAEGAQFDVVLSNHVLHHLSDAELPRMLQDTRALVGDTGVVVHHDIARADAAYALYRAGTAPFSGTVLAGTFIREDGLISIRRSYTAQELAAVVPQGWTVRTRMPFRLELRWNPTTP
ncbi:methyltransferase domain-containing protein [Microbacterium sp. SSW1-49]|uniref:Methyltransferase domain-containing protein n=1 Tax=Microbacterium croceum TaxID=2851645 RepID=A0ABT0FHJ5_9MICO|nr:methyltransferase domain-containing protein [Microbacterium croceum]MCK2037202.1 methyltransferase domain-containing protein [Microbacterium croceum]